MKNKNHEVILSIIRDAIIVDRTFYLLFKINNVMKPNDVEERYEPQHSFRGVENAFKLLGVTSDKVAHELYAAYDPYCYGDENFEELPEKIYVEWLSILANHYVEEKVGVIQMDRP